MRYFVKSETTESKRTVPIQMVNIDDGITPETGLTLVVEILKPGAVSYASIAGSSAEISDGTYLITLAAADLSAVGHGMLKVEDEVTEPTASAQYIPIFIKDEEIDSTATEPITPLKALEVILAAIIGQTVVSTVDSDTKRVQFLGRDDATVIAQVDVSTTTAGSREDSLIDP